ncbi:hypothetical protein C0992_006890 [Termitomyces sp. T32_za158]|nr:hypothetical protein C0992_006890 [Termitomyces sp. T32_za158]
MSTRGRSPSPRPPADIDMDVTDAPAPDKPNAKVVIITNLTRNVAESHLQTIFSFYGPIAKIDLPVYGKCGALGPRRRSPSYSRGGYARGRRSRSRSYSVQIRVVFFLLEVQPQ